MRRKPKVLVLLGTLDLGGAETLSFNITAHLRQRGFEIDYLIHDQRPFLYYESRLRELGSKVIRVPSKAESPIRYLLSLWYTIKNSDYRILHRFCENSFGIFELAPFLFSRKVIFHMVSDNSRHLKYRSYRLLNSLGRFFCRKIQVSRVACSKSSAMFGFGEPTKWILLRNAIDFNPYIKGTGAVEMSFCDHQGVVLGIVARLVAQKNVSFCVRVLAKVRAAGCPATLVVVGYGPELDSLKELSRVYGVEENIVFLGLIEDWRVIPNFDFFLMPSLFEGVPLALVAAQVSDKPVLVSDRVSEEALFGEECYALPIDPVDEASELWAKAIVTLQSNGSSQLKRFLCRGATREEYDIKVAANMMGEIYGNV